MPTTTPTIATDLPRELDPRFQRSLEVFREGLARELEAQKQQSRRSDLRVLLRERLDPQQGKYQTAFEAERPSEQIVFGAKGHLLSVQHGEIPVKVVQTEDLHLVLQSDVQLEETEYRLSLSPWFLFERLQDQLDLLEKSANDRQVSAALQAFGIVKPEILTEIETGGEGLNSGQRRAVNVVLSHSASRIWGPPGTGKTTTLAVLVCELVALGQRVLITSNTHAALDQILSGLLKHQELQPSVDDGRIARLGRCLPEHRHCGVREITRQQEHKLKERIDQAVARLVILRGHLLYIEGPLRDLRLASGPHEQLALFEEPEPQGLSGKWLSEFLGEKRGKRWRDLSLPTQCQLLERFYRRLEFLKKATSQRIVECREVLAQRQRNTVSRAHVVLSTLANLTTSHWMDGEEFDNVVIEEAGMALLPALFLACTRSQKRTLAVGDPLQLSSILVSRDSYVQRALGRNIFEVGETPQAMLTTQYRMHPEIGDFVSHLAYDNKLQHGRPLEDFAEWVSRDPLEGGALAGFDLHGTSTCQRKPGESSRFNEESAEVCLKLALRAAAAGFTEVAVISPYRRQVRVLRDRLSDDLKGIVECDTVHRFQGKEKEVVIIDLVDSESLGPGTLIRDDHRGAAQLLNVAFSRAQCKLFLVGELSYLCRQNPESFVGKAVTYLAKTKKLFKVQGKS